MFSGAGLSRDGVMFGLGDRAAAESDAAQAGKEEAVAAVGLARAQLMRHCEPTGPAGSGRPDDKLREAIQRSTRSRRLDCFVAPAPRNDVVDSIYGRACE